MNNRSGFKVQGSRFQVYLLLVVAFAFTLSCSSEQSENAKVQERLSMTELQQFTSGKKIYKQRCQNCHMEDGEGLGKLIPPLKNSNYLLENLPEAVRSIKYGLKGPIIVNGKSYNQPMPANPNLTNIEILELMIYITNAWDNPGAEIDLGVVESVFE